MGPRVTPPVGNKYPRHSQNCIPVEKIIDKRCKEFNCLCCKTFNPNLLDCHLIIRLGLSNKSYSNQPKQFLSLPAKL